VPIARWVEHPYCEYLCGETYFPHEPLIHPTSLTRYRQRLNASGREELLQLTIGAGRVIQERDLAEVLVDLTVMEKAITYPTDSKLYLKSLQRLNRQANAHGVKLRRSYTRTGKRLAIKVSRYAYARQYRRMRKALKQLKGRLGRVVRDIEPKTASWPTLPESLANELTLARRLLAQQPNGSSKSKAHKRYELGVKVGVVASLRAPFILAAHSKNLYLNLMLLVCLIERSCAMHWQNLLGSTQCAQAHARFFLIAPLNRSGPRRNLGARLRRLTTR
jgi:IS5 family transposase